jgi:hypothetical protein
MPVAAIPAPNRAFRWRGKLYHLTYRGHIPHQSLLNRLHAISGIKVLGYSCVHEASDREAPYDHTHFAWMWVKAVDMVGCDRMDVLHNGAMVHPHILSKKSLAWMEGIFTRYHLGHKNDDEGKPKFVAPAGGPWQEVPQAFEWTEYIVTEVSEASDLLGGVLAAGIRPKSVSDIRLLQQHKRPALFDHNYPASSFLPQVLPQAYVTRVVGTLHIHGNIDLGKTDWACAQFSNPLYITSRDGLRAFLPLFHDGIVLDKMEFQDWKVTDCESLTDWTQPAEVSCRYGCAKIPKHTPKIIVTNARDVWPADPYNRIVGRRVAQMHVSACMF